MMHLLMSWKDSLSLFKPSKFKIFLANVLKSLKQTYRVWFKYWWWVMGIYFVGSMTTMFFRAKPLLSFLLDGSTFGVVFKTTSNLPHWIYWPIITSYLCALVLFATAFLSARSSSDTKNYRYFFSYGWHFLFIGSGVSLANSIFELFQPSLYELGQTCMPFAIVITLPILIFVMAFNAFFILFELDSSSSMLLKPLFYAGRMVVYNAPFCIIMASLLAVLLFTGEAINFAIIRTILFFMGSAYISFVLTALNVITEFFFIPIIACVVTTYYYMKKS